MPNEEANANKKQVNFNPQTHAFDQYVYVCKQTELYRYFNLIQHQIFGKPLALKQCKTYVHMVVCLHVIPQLISNKNNISHSDALLQLKAASSKQISGE